MVSRMSSGPSTRMDTHQPTQVHTTVNGSEPKRRNACDHCRNKKTKCSGEYPACKACIDNNVECIYSLQKQMGRPKKRQRTNSPEEAGGQNGTPASTGFVERAQANFGNMSLGGNMMDYDPFFSDFMVSSRSTSGVPALTPDTSQNSTPPLLNLPTELQDTRRTNSNSHTHAATSNRYYHPDASHAAGQSTAMLLGHGLLNVEGSNIHQHRMGQSNLDTPMFPLANINSTTMVTYNRYYIDGQTYYKDTNGNLIKDTSVSHDSLGDTWGNHDLGGQSDFDFDDIDWTSLLANEPGIGSLGDETNMSMGNDNSSVGSNGQFMAMVDAMSPTQPLDANLGLLEGPPECTCVEVLSRHLADMKRMKDYSFPGALHPLRTAVQAAIDAMDCQQCVQHMVSAITQTTLLGTIIMTAAANYNHVLRWIDEEAKRAEENDEEKRFRLADMNTSNSHLHTGGLGCAAAFNISLSPTDWKKMVKKVVKAEVSGPSDGNDCCGYYLQMLKKMENRHVRAANMEPPADAPIDPDTGLKMGGKNLPKEDHMCLKYAVYGKKLLGMASWED